jgi:hypothetical protein
MGKKKKDKATETKNESSIKSKAESFLDNLRPTTTAGKSEHTRGNKTKSDNKVPALNGKTKKVVAGGIVAVALGALTLVGLNRSSSSEDAVVKTSAPTAAVSEKPSARATSEAAAASMLPQPLAPKKARLAEPTKKQSEVAKPSKTSAKKSGKLASKTKAKDKVKKSVAKTKKPKATKKSSKKTLAAKSID